MNIARNVERSCRRFPDKDALIFESHAFTFRELNELGNRAARALLHAGVSRGDRVALFLPNTPSFVTTCLGINKAGAIVVPIHSGLKTEEIGFILRDCGAKVLVTTDTLRAHVRPETLPDLLRVWLADDDAGGETSLRRVMAEASPEFEALEMGPEEPAAILYTSGTTGFPKGAMLSHRNVVSNVTTCVEVIGIGPEDRVLLFLPLFHSFGQYAALNPCFEAGATLILHREFKIGAVLKSIVDHGVTTMYAVPTIYTVLCEEATERQMRSVRRCISAAANLPQEIAAAWRHKFRLPIHEGYGLTETSLACFNPVPQAKPGSVGVPLSAVDVRIVDAGGREVAPGERGEITIGGPGVMLGYWNRPAESADAMTDGRFHTGDIGTVDADGYVYVVDRVKDMVNVGGMKVYPSEVENTLYQHPAVLEAAVYGVPDAVLSERVVADIVPRHSDDVRAEDIIAHCRDHLADFKVPSQVRVVSSLPKSRTGKILKRVLREQFPRGGREGEAPSVATDIRLTQAAIEQWITEWIAGKLTLAPERLQPGQTFASYGMNSILAVMLIHDLNRWLARTVTPDLESSLSATVAFAHPTVEQLATFVWRLLQPTSVPAAVDQGKGAGQEKPPVAGAAVYPLSHGQRALWFVHQLAPGSHAYNTAVGVRIRSAVDARLLQDAFQALPDRHPCLRTTFVLNEEGEPEQRVQPRQLVDFQEYDATRWSWDDLNDRVVEARQAPFDLERGPMLRARLFTRAEDDRILLFTIHHIVIDGWSQWTLLEELGAVYSGLKDQTEPLLAPIESHYADYVRWQRNLLEGAEGERLWRYWREQLAGELPVLDLPTDHPYPPVQTYNGASIPFHLPDSLTRSLRELAQREEVGLFTVLLTAFQILIHRYTGQEDVLIGSPAMGRTVSRFADIAGYFINMLVLRVDMSGDLTVRSLLDRTRRVVLEGLEHQDYPFPLLVERLHPDRDRSRPPLFQVSFVLQCPQKSAAVARLFAPVVTGGRVNIGGLELEAFPVAQQEGQFDVSLEVTETDDSLVGTFQYNSDLFEPATVRRMVGHYQTLLSAIAADASQSIHTLPLLTEAERDQQRVWNETGTSDALDTTVVDLVERQVDATPDQIALVYDGQALSYRQLNERANRLAHYLLNLKGRTAGAAHPLIAVAVDRSLDMIACLLAIHKTGAAYVPVDPSQPSSRIAAVLNESGAPIVVTHSHIRERLTLDALRHDCVDVCLDEMDLTGQPITNPEVSHRPDDLAYVIYTSGSTGTPKGAMVEHLGMLNHIYAKVDDLRLSRADVIAHTASLTFDISVWQAFTALVLGGRVHILSETAAKDPHALLETVTSGGITVVEIVPSLLRAVLQEIDEVPERPDLSALRWMILTGEALPPELCIAWCAAYPRIPLFNAYGPTECSDDVSHYPMHEPPAAGALRVPIGRPIKNMRLYVLDHDLQPLPVGVAGELHVAGVGVGRGYWNDQARTAEAFIEDPFRPGEVMYKTGDLARWLEDGNLEYLGRLDYQIKLRGFRIECGEIEAVLCQHDAVRAAVVSLHDADGQKCLVAYVTLGEGPSGVSADDADDRSIASALREWVKERLPDYMIPSHFTVLAQFPLTPNGKIDRRALPAPTAGAAGAHEPPRSDVERRLVDIWRLFLKQEAIGIHDNFFSLGGDSILSIQIVARARQAGLRFTAGDLFEHPTIAELAAVTGSSARIDADQGLIDGGAPLTPIQHYLFAAELPEYWHYNQSILLEVPAEIDVQALGRAWAAVGSHHDALRSRFHRIDGEWRQSFAASSELPSCTVEDLSLSADPFGELQRRIGVHQASLNLSSGPIARLVVFRLRDSSRLFWCMHHAVVDGVSWRILLEDLHRAYVQFAAGVPLSLPAKTSSFKAWATRLEQFATSPALSAQRDYWQSLPRFVLPVDNPAGENRLEHQQIVTGTLSVQETHALLREAPAAYNTRINDMLLTALALALAEWTGSPQCLIDVEGHGRVALFEDIDVSRTVGWFTTMYPVALTLPAGAESDPGKALKAVKEEIRAVPLEGIGYGLHAQPHFDAFPKGDVLFNYFGQFDQGVESDIFRFADEESGGNVSLKGRRSHLLEVNGIVMKGRLRLEWAYGDCHEPATIAALARNFTSHLQRLIDHCARGRQGVTPSDFPLATVDQATLDALYDRVDGLQDLYPLSPMQQGMVFHTVLEPESGAYFEQTQLILNDLEPAAFKLAWQHQLERHSTLRSTFLTNHDPLLQAVQADVPLVWREHDWRHLPEATQRSEQAALLDRERARGFDLSRAPLMRFDLVRLDEQRYAFIQHYHHALLDGWCVPMMFNEVRESYRAIREGRSPALSPARPYRDYISWLRQQETETAHRYWRERLAGFAAPTPIPAIDKKASSPVYRDAQFDLDVPLTRELQRFQRRQRLTLNTVIQGAWALLLSRYSQEADVCCGVTVSGRDVPLPGIERMMGLFINTVPLRVEVDAEEAATDYLRRVQAQHQHDNRHAHVPLFEIQAASEVPNGTALFDSLLIFENYPVDDPTDEVSPGYTVEAVDVIEFTNYPLTVIVIPGRALSVRISYDSRRVSPEQIAAIWEHFHSLIRAIVEHPDQAIGRLPMIGREEVQQLLAWNDTAIDFPGEALVIELFERQVKQTPDRTAVRCGQQRLTYREVNDRANQLARHVVRLTAEAGTGRPRSHGGLVAIAMERSPEMITALLAILKAGAAYLPIDPGYPRDRIRHMLEDSAAPLMLTERQHKERLSFPDLEAGCLTVCLDEDECDVSDAPREDLEARISPEDLAYVIYTSGSTGKPKGVMIEHRNLSNILLDMRLRTGLAPEDTFLAVTTLSFDIAALEIFLPLIAGSCLHLATREEACDGFALRRLVEEGVSIMQATPATWQLLKQSGWQALAPINILCGGEALAPELANYLVQNSRHVWNVYGPTETTIWSAAHLCESSPAPPSIGRPLGNTRIHILDSQHQLLPPGIVGELCISGRGVARGYLNRPELTAEKFVEVDLLGKTERVYRTGDLARWLPGGSLEYRGRRDQQIKLRGFRIELGEIEAVLHQHPAVTEAIALLHGDPDDQRIACFVTRDPSANRDDDRGLAAELRGWLEGQLPDYMRPDTVTVLQHVPRTPNGKVDRGALKPHAPAIHAGQVLPATDVEKRIAQVWQKVLRLDHIDIHRKFFEAGGHSLLLMRTLNELRAVFGQALSMVDLFQYPTIHALAKHIARKDPGVAAPSSGVQSPTSTKDIAIIGMSGRFPGAPDVDAFWRNLRGGVESIHFFSDEELLAAGVDPALLKRPDYVKARGVLEDVEYFDAAFFGYSPREAEIIDPQQRVFLECAWEALEHAGYSVDRIGGRTGVYAGAGMNGYLLNNLYPAYHGPMAPVSDYQLMIGNDKDYLPTRTSYKLNLRGPSIAVQTACSTSLVAVALAVESLRHGTCDMALAGGVSIANPQTAGYLYQPGMILSPDGHCRAFDASAQGTVGGNGIGVVVLKGLEQAQADGDYIHAVIKGAAINSDGGSKISYTAPGVEGQAAVIAEAMRDVDPETITYLEAHGTATPLGDTIEMAALIHAYRSRTSKKHCGIL